MSQTQGDVVRLQRLSQRSDRSGHCWVMTHTQLSTGFLGTAEQPEDSSALIAGAVIADSHNDAQGLALYRSCPPSDLMTSACLAAAEMALSVSNHNTTAAADKLYLAVHRDNGIGAEEHMLSTRLLRLSARAVDGAGVIDVDLSDFDEVDHLQASLDAFRRGAAVCGQFAVAAALTIRDQAPAALASTA